MSDIKWNTFTKRKVEVRAIRYDNTEEQLRFICQQSRGTKTEAYVSIEARDCSAMHPTGFDRPILYIRTLEGDMEVRCGDYVVVGTNGEFYPCKPDPFHQVHQSTDLAWSFWELNETSIIDICDLIHNTDSSTIHGVAKSYILSTYMSLGYLEVKDLSGRVHRAVYGDYIAQSTDGGFHVVTADVYRYMTA